MTRTPRSENADPTLHDGTPGAAHAEPLLAVRTRSSTLALPLTLPVGLALLAIAACGPAGAGGAGSDARAADGSTGPGSTGENARRAASAETSTDPVDLAGGARVRIEGLGTLAFPNSGAEEAQEPFLRGVLLLHSFEYRRAAEAFRRAQEADPHFALAYWGEAMTHNHPLWREQNVAAARAVLGRLAPTPGARRARAGTEREARYLDAVEALYGEGTKGARDSAYLRAMAGLARARPDDHEARVFHALSLLGSRDGTRDFATYMRAAATAWPVFLENPDHPGAAHYLIHAFDDPIHAPLGLPAARAYSGIAPGAPHAQHMTSHIFLALGMWEEVVRANRRALEAQNAERAARGEPPNVCGHYGSWLHYGHLQRGETEAALALLEACHGRVLEEATAGEWSYFVDMRARWILDREAWDGTERWRAEPPAGTSAFGRDLSTEVRFTDAFAALRRGATGPARTLLTRLERTEDPRLRVHRDQLRGLLALAAGRTEEGLRWLRAAAEGEKALPFEFGPPALQKPSHELLAEELLRLGRRKEALEAYRAAAARTPGRALVERGLERVRVPGG